MNTNPEIKHAKSKEQIAEEFGIYVKILNKWLKGVHIIIKIGLKDFKVQVLEEIQSEENHKSEGKHLYNMWFVISKKLLN